MTHHRPKSPSPTKLPAVPVEVGDTVVGLEPVTSDQNLAVPSPSLSGVSQDLPPSHKREVTAPMEIPHEMRVPGLNETTPSTPLALAAPNLAKVVHAELHKAHASAPVAPPLGAAPDNTPFEPQPALGGSEPLVTPLNPAAALGPSFDPPTDELPPKKKRESGPRRSHPEMPVAKPIDEVPTGPPRKSITEMPAIPTGKKPTQDELPKARSKSKLDLPVQTAPDAMSQTMDEPPPISELSTGPVPAVVSEAATVRKSRTDVPRPKLGNSGEKAQARRDGVDTSPLPPVPEPNSTPKMQVPPPGILERPTSPRTLPQVPPVLPFGGVEDPRFKRAAMVIGIVCAVVVMALVSWELLKAQPSLPPEEALKPAYIELPAPPRKEEPVEQRAAVPSKPLEIEVTTDAGTTRVVAGTLNVWCDPDANVFVDGRDLGFTPTHSILPSGKITFALLNPKIGLHKVETVELQPGENKNVTYHFSPGFLEVVADDDAKVSVDGKPITNRTMQVWEGLHRVDAIYGHDKVSKSAEVIPGETTTIEVRPQ
jgi:hypothetical protein